MPLISLLIWYYSEIFLFHVNPSKQCLTLNLCQCSASCGDGVQQREVFCQAGDQRIPEESGCTQHSRPPTSQSCGVAACPSRYRWREGDWQTVSRASPDPSRGSVCCCCCCCRSCCCSCFSPPPPPHAAAASSVSFPPPSPSVAPAAA